jgi:hypothetical protein
MLIPSTIVIGTAHNPFCHFKVCGHLMLLLNYTDDTDYHILPSGHGTASMEKKIVKSMTLSS